LGGTDGKYGCNATEKIEVPNIVKHISEYYEKSVVSQQKIKTQQTVAINKGLTADSFKLMQ
jgi:hypothetical protein